MAGFKWLFIVLCTNIYFAKCEVTEDINTNVDESYRTQIWSLLKYLNDDPNRQYNFNYGTLIDAQNQGDGNVKIKFKASVDCRSNDQPCPNVQSCEGTVKYDTSQALYIALPGVACNPIQQIGIPVSETKESATVLKNEQPVQVSPESAVDGEHFVAVRAKPSFCAGCPIDLATNVDGLDVLTELALRHIESERSNTHTVLKVLRVQQQVVAGIKYILLLEIAPTECRVTSETEPVSRDSCAVISKAEPEICEITYLQKPWISRSKHIVGNNCTRTQEYLALDSYPNTRNDLENEIDINYNKKNPMHYPSDVVITNSVQNFDRIANHGNGDDLVKDDPSSVRLAELESQIVFQKTNDDLGKSTSATTLVSENVDSAPETSTTFSDSFDINVEMSDQPYSTASPVTEQHSNKDTSSSEESSEEQQKNKKVKKAESSEESSEEIKKRSKRATKLERVSEDEINFVKTLADNSLAALDQIDSDNRKRVVLKVLSAKKMHLEGFIYHLKLKVGISECPEEEAVIKDLNTFVETEEDDCKQRIIKDLTKICKVQIFVNNEKTDSKILKSQCQNIKKDAQKRSGRNARQANEPLIGGATVLSLTDPRLAELTSHTVKNMNLQSQHDTQYKIVEVISATRQLVGGILYKIRAKLALTDCSKNDAKDLNNCQARETPKLGTISIWDQPWLPDGRETNVTLDNNEVYSFRTPHPGRSARSPNRPLVGGPAKLELSNPIINELTSHSLEHLDKHTPHKNKYKLIKVDSATSQVVSGSLYKIEGQFSLSDCLKTETKDRNLCKALDEAKSGLITIWDQPWLPKGRQTNVTIGEETYSFRTNSPAMRESTRRKRSLLGGAKDLKTNDPRIRKLTEPALKHLNAQTEHENQYKIIKVLSATSQVVSGTLYKIKVKIALSSCGKNEEIHIEHCEVTEEPKLGVITIWDRPWIKNGKETNITIERDVHEHYSFRSKRSLAFNTNNKHGLHMKMFTNFMNEHEKTYDNEEEFKYRFKVFRSNMKLAEHLNKNEQGTAKYGPTKFADLTPKQFKKYLGLSTSLKQENVIPYPQAIIPDVQLPIQFDWRDKGVVTPVKNQGQCGSCWAFSVTGNVEGQNAIKNGKLIELSEQELVDCDKMDEGCNGGLMDNAYRAIEQMGGLETEQDYPYDAEDEKCSFNRTLAKVQISGAVNISSDETEMAKWLIKNGPISIAINANAMQLYMGGVSHPWKFLCSPKNLDHGVLIVGYGVHKYPMFNKTLPYWIVKNSWGPSWGERGYYRVFRGDGTCGVNQMASSSIIGG